MPEIVETHQFKKGRKNASVYPWEEWSDGQIRKLTRGIDFTCKVSSFQNAAYWWARKNGLTASTNIVRVDQVMLRIAPKPTVVPSITKNKPKK